MLLQFRGVDPQLRARVESRLAEDPDPVIRAEPGQSCCSPRRHHDDLRMALGLESVTEGVA